MARTTGRSEQNGFGRPLAVQIFADASRACPREPGTYSRAPADALQASGRDAVAWRLMQLELKRFSVDATLMRLRRLQARRLC